MCIKKTSVIISTYNGEKFIYEQLKSIVNQQVTVDEVLIRDDGSIDNTVEIIQEFIKDQGLDNWNLICGTNIGWKKSYRLLLEWTNADFVFLCDQDDVWMENKVGEMLSVFEKYHDAELVSSEYDLLLYDKLKKLRHAGTIEKRNIDNKFFHNLRPGASFCISKKLIKKMLSIWDDDLPHDAQLWVYATLSGSLYSINKALFAYRRHSMTATGRDRGSLDAKLRNVTYEEKLISQCRIYNLDLGDIDKIISGATAYAQKRKTFLTYPTLLNGIRLCGIGKYYITFWTLLGDIKAVIFK